MRTEKILKVMKVLVWIVFIGSCIKTGTIAVLSVYSLISGNELTESIYAGFYIDGLMEQNTFAYAMILASVIIVEALKAYLFFFVTKFFSKINLERPFSTATSQLLVSISYIALAIGVFSMLGNAFMQWYRSQGILFSYDWVSNEFLFLAGILFIIAAVFKRGLALQSETEFMV